MTSNPEVNGRRSAVAQFCSFTEPASERKRPGGPLTGIRSQRPRLRLNAEAYRQLCHQVLERDGWRCQCCGRAEDLQVHHLQPRSRRGYFAAPSLSSSTASAMISPDEDRTTVHRRVHSGPSGHTKASSRTFNFSQGLSLRNYASFTAGRAGARGIGRTSPACRPSAYSSG
jgi:hypothetical protein